MSQVYNLEPPTKGKVVLHTTHGDIEIELWPKEAPKVCAASWQVEDDHHLALHAQSNMLVHLLCHTQSTYITLSQMAGVRVHPWP